MCIPVCGNHSIMLNKFGNITKKVSPILELMKNETANVLSCIQTGDLTELGNTVERLGLLTSRLYSEYLSSQNAFSENPNLLNEALNILTASQEAAVKAQAVLNQQQYAGPGDEAEIEEVVEEEPFLVKAERRLTLFAAVGTPIIVYHFSKDFPAWKQHVIRGAAIIGGIVALRAYTKQR
jgi:hypothetical protein